ncbi:18933_t:CDS:2 [Funneliformis geosporum]|uniref:Mitochondrial DNA polymerase catalytic subunit n=1 Tax=Funneliformis geosporum TaxID=1117311 RepID=A0A9W4SM05_9GLOM|nr:16296_t:CDS:2 [Funneliformis geosporum]CAI2175881.1 18933_t:CDS:2 [Funneliformis geosporum]
MLLNTRQLNNILLTKTLSVDRTHRTRQFLQSVSTRYVATEGKNGSMPSNFLTKPDQWLREITWNKFFTGVPQLDASISKRPEHDLKIESKKHTIENKLEMGRQQLQEEQFQRVINEAGVDMLPDWLYSQVFNRTARPIPRKNLVKISMEHLKKQEHYNKKTDNIPTISQFELPKLCGKTISEHFWRIGEEQARPIRDLAMRLISTDLSAMPSKTNWMLSPGWTRYEEGKLPKAVDYPSETILCFNSKTFDDYKYPLIACAASSTAWYSWISPRLINNDVNDSLYLIPMGDLKGNRLFVGHDVGIDRIRVKEEYSYVGSNVNYLDTKSLHIAVGGICSRLRDDWNKYHKAIENKDDQYLLQKNNFQKIYDVSSVSDLPDLYKFYCGKCLDDQRRDIFVKGTFKELQNKENLQRAIASCANNVEAIHRVFQRLFPTFLDVCPHPVSIAGVIHMGSMFLTTNKDWEKFISNSEATYKVLNDSIESTLGKLADKALEERNKHDEDLWLKQLNWRTDGGDHPEWYNKIYNKKSKKVRVTALSQIAPILLKLKWINYPVHYSKQYGWVYRVPIGDTNFIANSKPLEFLTQPEHVHYEPRYLEDQSGLYYCIPNKGGKNNRCGTPLAKKYIGCFENGTLQSDCKEAEEILKFHAACTYWISIRDRIKSQLIIYPGNSGINNFGFDLSDDENIGILLPKTITMGTITRRMVENTWAVATNPKEYLIGSEQRSMIKAPKGYKIIGADVDSQEMWISSLISDAEFGFYGATGLGLMMLQGNKSDGTDLHSRTAKILGILREDAKVFNYSRLYGAGIKTIWEMLENSLVNINIEEAKERAKILFNKTKGQNCYDLCNNGRRFWFGGSETYLANRLEEIATSSEPVTPVLRCGITNALKSASVNQGYMTSRVNWIVQSSGVDYLHLLLVSMKYLIKKYNINARFMISVHDDLRYLVKEEDAYRAALALQISNLWTRAMFSHMLGIEDLPLTTAFFAGVDIDHVYRKEVDMKCSTVSHQNEIDSGVCVSMKDILKHQKTLRRDGCKELFETDSIRNIKPYDAFLWKPYQPTNDDLYLKAQSMSSIEEIRNLYDPKKNNSVASIPRHFMEEQNSTHTYQKLTKKKRVFEPYVEISKVEGQKNKKSR